MKPTKNRYFCVDANRPKMLFDSEKAAERFMKFNSEEMLEGEGKGKAPIRAYYCIACGGWHVTSQPEPTHKRKTRTERYFETHEVIIDPVKFKDRLLMEVVDCVANFILKKDSNCKTHIIHLIDKFNTYMNTDKRMQRQLRHYMPVVKLFKEFITGDVKGDVLTIIQTLKEDKAAYCNAICLNNKIKKKIQLLKQL